MFKKLPLIAAVGVLAIATTLPATAPAASKCSSHAVSYFAQGTYVSSSAPLVASKSWSGTLTIKLKSANHHFKKANGLSVKTTAKGTLYTYMITRAKVHFGKGVKSPTTAPDHLTVSGTVTELSKGCTSKTPTVTIKTITVSK